MSNRLKVFLCHSSADKTTVRELYDRLLTEGWIDPWLDEKKLLPGQDWDLAIEKAVEESHAVIVCVSNSSVTKEGYIQKELRFVLDIALTKPEEEIFVIPLRLEDCQPPRRLRAFHYVDYFPKPQQDNAFNMVLESLKLRAGTVGVKVGRDSVPTTPAEPKPTQVVAPSASRIASQVYDFEPQMIHIPAGKFVMGSNDYDDAKPPHTVELSEYYIGKYPVTNREYQAFVRDAKYKAPKSWGGDQFPQGKANHPVVYVSWKDAVAYCKWLSKKTGSQYRLPTEAEWEKAARGTDDHRYPWGSAAPNKDLLNYKNNVGDTTVVGKYEGGKSPYGVYDMVGNVWEWVNDWYGKTYYQKSPTKNPLGPTSGESRVLRGGSWGNFDFHNVHSVYRCYNAPTYIIDDVGFRCACSV
jgi:formylglycine-generating enzyme required for sulfatase activity